MAADLKDPTHPYHRAPRGVWFIAGTPIGRPYPCACVLGQHCKPWHPGAETRPCTCAGRTDLDAMPAHCCARRATETARRTEATAA